MVAQYPIGSEKPKKSGERNWLYMTILFVALGIALFGMEHKFQLFSGGE